MLAFLNSTSKAKLIMSRSISQDCFYKRKLIIVSVYSIYDLFWIDQLSKGKISEINKTYFVLQALKRSRHYQLLYKLKKVYEQHRLKILDVQMYERSDYLVLLISHTIELSGQFFFKLFETKNYKFTIFLVYLYQRLE